MPVSNRQLVELFTERASAYPEHSNYSGKYDSDVTAALDKLQNIMGAIKGILPEEKYQELETVINEYARAKGDAGFLYGVCAHAVIGGTVNGNNNTMG